jgi:hypothetical protein
MNFLEIFTDKRMIFGAYFYETKYSRWRCNSLIIACFILKSLITFEQNNIEILFLHMKNLIFSYNYELKLNFEILIEKYANTEHFMNSSLKV